MTSLELINVRVGDNPAPTRLLIEDGRFVSRLSRPAPTLDLAGCLVLPGLVETHIHLDKACILSRCHLQEGTLAEAIAQTRQAKAAFTKADVYARGAAVLEQAITQGTTHMRTHVEIDPGIGLTGLRAIRQLQADYAWAVTLEICVFPQEGMLDNPGTEALLCQALDEGAEVLGGCPYTDSDPPAQIRRLFELAVAYDRDLDLHLDFDLQVAGMTLGEVIRCTHAHGWHGRVTVGHATKLSALPKAELIAMGHALAEAGVQVTCLPATDLFLTGRERFHDKPRGVAPLAQLHQCGVTCSVSSNNIGNPFTPYGDASLVRQANLYANVAQLGTPQELLMCLGWISRTSARLLRLRDYGLEPGCRADFVVFDVPSPADVIGRIAPPLMGFKHGVQTFERPAAQLLRSPLKARPVPVAS
ncbi:amidohydrolase family protein [Pseudomonas sp. PSKL.D1]|uniref:amidohydrolase family protein n=1 Tax=Pseudomonas sp. PSKL.D1 TaxID=3029060 RepID=UPI002380FBA6|nr:amidohydrolase family protein [Pseudomonas sp. PSKL.D1]WDY60453.1 amidohydrolase family protein [Pseudomonas sp. PSKL.D1]